MAVSLTFSINSRCESVKISMNQAKDNDKENRKRKILTEGDPFVVEFRILPSLPHRDPVIVRQALFSTSDLPEILWNFSHLDDGKRLALAQKPHFYEGLPENVNAYVGTFHHRPKLECFRGSLFVLKSEERRVFLECSTPQAFDNVWIISDNVSASRGILIFRHIYGDLVGEANVLRHFPPTLLCSRVVPDGPEQFKLEAPSILEYTLSPPLSNPSWDWLQPSLRTPGFVSMWHLFILLCNYVTFGNRSGVVFMVLVHHVL
ncbi:hypothetical protein F5148DRAFT_176483 [Russula earlei]|uniref:Uncharacterized protein n=1 Tax=Russula earlei TaxID=71964 RepID=A0ACC0U5C7_9AGAM|nr:hypothetical protein F5148DRAFT_176483 [Russula earlei]